jgi:SM-20-related protein
MKPSFFINRGLFFKASFVPPGACARLRSALRHLPGAPATVRREGQTVVDAEARRVARFWPPAALRALVEQPLTAVKQELEAHFQVVLQGYEDPQFLRYGEGDFCRPHRDTDTSGPGADYMKARRVSVVIFLNGETATPQPGTFSGGDLRFYQLLEDPRWQDCGFPLSGEEGLLVAFKSQLMHEVTPVTGGARWTVVTWFY